MIKSDPRRQDGIDKIASEAKQKNSIRLLDHMFNEVCEFLIKIFGKFSELSERTNGSKYVVWIRGGIKYTFTAEFVEETHDDYPKDADFIKDHERIDEQGGKLSKRNQVIEDLR